MLHSEYALFIGAEKESIHTEFVVTDTFFLIFSSHDSTKSETSLNHLLKKVSEEIESQNPTDLSSFETLLDQLLIKHIPHKAFSLSAGLLVDSIIYLKTYGDGHVLLKRGSKLGRIIQGGLSASGNALTGDTIIFTNQTFLELIDTTTLSEKMTDVRPKEIVDTITPLVKMNDDTGSIALFVRIEKKPEIEETITEEPTQVETSGEDATQQDVNWPPKQSTSTSLMRQKIDAMVAGIVIRFSNYQMSTSKNKKLTFMIVIVIFVTLIWSVGFGVKRRANTELLKEIHQSQDVIDQKVQEASDVAGLNVDRSQILLSEAKTELEMIKKKAGTNEPALIQKMEEKVATAENSIVKKEDKKYDVFYDLKLINSTARANFMYKDKTAVLLLNGEGKQAYVLDLSKKSVKTYKKDELQGATIGAIYNDSVIFYVPQKGMYKIDSDGKATLVIPNDTDWGVIADMNIYNGNLYVLDTGKAEIYKYLVAENGYSDKKSYFKEGQKISISEGATIAIDSSLYLATEKKVYKFVTGVRDTFVVQFPDTGIHVFNQIITDKLTNNIYLLDKTNSKVYILSKTGQYEKQIESKIFKEADAITVLDDTKSIYVLVSDKIYSIAL